MALASIAQSNFLGGEWSLTAQGAFVDPDYKISMNFSLNGFPIETGAWCARSGTQHGGLTRTGAHGRVISFAFEEAAPYLMEFTDGFVRFWKNGLTLADTNDVAAVTAISTATPAVVTVTPAVTWADGDTVYFTDLDVNNPLLQNRRFFINSISGTTFSIMDETTGADINGSTLGAFVSGNVHRVAEQVTPYIGEAWDSPVMRSIQTEQSAYLLNNTIAPQVIIATNQANNPYATFRIEQVDFLDGPYLDPPTNGAIVTPSGVDPNSGPNNGRSGIIALSLSFTPYSATTAYSVGAFVSSAGLNYESIADQNVNNTPATSPSFWTAVSVAAAVNNGQGFLPTDVGRLVRLYSEPPAWVSTTTYPLGSVVSYNATNIPGASTYWQALVGSNTGNEPGTDLKNWVIVAAGSVLPVTGSGSGPAQWTWGSIISLANIISGTISGVAQIGDMARRPASFDGVLSKPQNTATIKTIVEAVTGGKGNFQYVFTGFVGQNYSSATGQPFAIASAVVFPTSDQGLFEAVYTAPAFFGKMTSVYGTLQLRASNTTPGSATSGTLLGTTTIVTNASFGGGASSSAKYGTSPKTIISTDQVSTWKFVWIVFQGSAVLQANGSGAQATFVFADSQIEFINASAGSSASGVDVEILGPPLLYTNPILTWRLGAYSDTTGWPTCGTYGDGRLWLSGAIPNRIDACYANGIVQGTNVVNFAPTDQWGFVTAAHALDYTFNAPDSNSVFWMEPDLQGYLAGTLAGEWLITAPTAGGISPLNISARRVTKIRCANVAPVKTEHTYAFVQAYGRKIIEYFPDVFSGKFTAPNLVKRARHLTTSGIAELAYQQELAPIIWARNNDGSLFGLTYRRDNLVSAQGPTFNAAHHHTLGSGWAVQSIAVGPSLNGILDALSMVTFDGDNHHVETMNDLFEEGDALVDAWFLDAAVAPSSYVIDNPLGILLQGLWHLNGQTVTAFIGGIDCGDFPVVDGGMSVPFFGQTFGGNTQANSLFTLAFASSFTGTIPMVVGFSYTSQGQLLTPQGPESGARNGPGFGKKKRFHGYQAQLVSTQGIYFGTSLSTSTTVASRARLAQLRTQNGAGGSLIASNVLFTGLHKETISDDPMGYTNQLAWEIPRPFPATITIMGGFLETADE